MNYSELRREYMLFGLDEKDLASDPFEQFSVWFQAAVDANLPLANSMALATVNPQTHRPSVRQVLLKSYDASGFVFYTAFDSRKGKELDAAGSASLLFWWIELERQIRVEGRVERLSDAEIDAYFATRPLGSRLAAWASTQGEVVADRRTLEQRLAEASARFGDQPPRPPYWGGYRVVPDGFEFWQGRESRLHDRLTYSLREDRGWLIQRLAP